MLPHKTRISHKIKILCGVVLLWGTASLSLLAQSDPTPMVRPAMTSGNGRDLIRHLETQSGWVISYSTRLCIEDNMTLSREQKSLLAHLQDLFVNCSFTWVIRDNRIILRPKEQGERRFVVNGYVRESPGQESLPSANIFSLQTGTGTTSNNYGFYSITLPPGQHTLSASFVGFGSQTAEFSLQKDTAIHFALQASIELSEVAVIGQKNYEFTHLTRTGAIMMPIDEIRRTPALLGETDLVKSIQMLPGIQGGSEGFSGLYVRGGGPDQNLILLDDVPVYNIGHLLGFFSIFNADAVRHVSVMKGGFPARYGGRLSSVIDIRMIEGNNEQINGTLNLGLLSSGVSVNGPVVKDKSGFAVSFRRTYLDAIAGLAQRGRDETTNYFFYDLNAKFNHTFNPRHRLYLSVYLGRDKYFTTYNYQDISSDDTGGQNSEVMTSINDENNAGWGNFVTALRWNFIITPKLFSNLTTTYSDYRFFIGVQRNNQFNNQWDSYEQRYLSGIKDLGVKMDFDYFPASNHLIKFGFNGIRHSFNPGVDIIKRSVNTTFPLDTTIGDLKLLGSELHTYAESEFMIGSRLRINAGGRFILFKGKNEYYQSIEPRLAINYALRPTWNLRGSYNHMSQYIHMVSSSNVALPTDLWLPVTDKIPPMRSRQVSLGSEWALDQQQTFTLSTEVYYKWLYNLLHYKESTGFFDYSTEWEDKLTGGEGISYGTELLFRKNKGSLTGWLGYTYANTTNRYEDLNQGRSFPARFDRRHDLNLSLNYRFNQRVDGGIMWQFGSGTPVTLPSEKFFAPEYPFGEHVTPSAGYSENASSLNAFRMPAFHRLDVGFNFTKERPSTTRIWSIGIINLYGRQNPFILYFASDENAEPGTAQRKLKQLSLFPFPIPYVKYTLKF